MTPLNPQWFDKDCKLSKLLKNEMYFTEEIEHYENLHKYLVVCRLYTNIWRQNKSSRLCVKIKHREYKTKGLNELIINVNNAKSFWAKFRAFTNQKKCIRNKITKDELEAHFKWLLNPGSDTSNHNDLASIDPNENVAIDDEQSSIYLTVTSWKKR